MIVRAPTAWLDGYAKAARCLGKRDTTSFTGKIGNDVDRYVPGHAYRVVNVENAAGVGKRGEIAAATNAIGPGKRSTSRERAVNDVV